ncbi:hypothetical protein F5Y18DRAFT_443603 [Xylariaceae sp. FL1019]|nr:hypothetical protein F5Y18DRAFT_443603 [Xylariaceae sp. FL1019]
MASLMTRDEPTVGTPQAVPSADELDVIVLFERLGAAFSLVGVLLIFLAFAACKRLRSVPNTFIVFASVSNLGASIACLIGYSGVLAGSTSPLCQAQAFLFELFMQSDPWWSFAMAVNVYMVFFFSANPQSFLQYWYIYVLVCYGVPFIPALWLLIIRDTAGHNVYGNATIWCWIDTEWKDLRIYTYYLPIWVCIALSTVIYFAVGYYVFKQRNQLRNISLTNPSRDAAGNRDSGEKNLFTNAAVMGTIHHEVVQVTTINTGSEQTNVVGSPGTAPTNWFDGPVEDLTRPHEQNKPGSPVPFASTVTRITADPLPKQENVWHRIRSGWTHWCNKFSHMDPVKLAYLRTSFVFAISVLITWTPSSINRVHDLIRPDEFSFALNLTSAIVLPLQGLWNAAIFFSTSWVTLGEELRAKINYFRGIPIGQDTADAVRSERERHRDFELERRVTRQNQDDTSSELSAATTLGQSCDGSDAYRCVSDTRASRE